MSSRPESVPVSAEQGRQLVAHARRALTAYFRMETGAPDAFQIESSRPIGGLFATLQKGGQLRGCIGFLSPASDLVTLVERAVVAAAVEDPRFPRVSESELEEISIQLSILTPMVPVESLEGIEVGRHGLVVEREDARGLLLPQVARERGWDRERFLAETCRKAGLAPDAFRDRRTTVLRFEALELSEPAPAG